jgi:predicted Zn-dependent protease
MRFGLAEAEKESEDWRVRRPDDPDVLEAAVDLLIEHGRGRSDAGRALTLLQPAIARHPYHRGLRLSLAYAFRRAGDVGAAEKVLREFLRRHPNDSSTRIQLAQIRHQNGDVNDARQILDAALDRDPHNSDVLWAKVEMLLGAGNVGGAQELIEDASQRMPWNIAWRANAIRLLVRCREHDRAIAVARQGVVLYPRGAMLWFLLGRTLSEMRRYARGNETETSLRRSLSLNRSFYDAADLLSWVLADQERYEEASEVMRSIAASMTDQSPACVRLAWIKRRQGRSADALREMIAALSAAPWNTSGWHILMGWLDEDRAWDESRHLLRDVPPQMLTNISFRVRRLELLRKAGDARAQLEVERDELARDFPGSITPAAEITPTAESAGQVTRRLPRAMDFLRISPWMWIATVMAIQLLLRNC